MQPTPAPDGLYYTLGHYSKNLLELRESSDAPPAIPGIFGPMPRMYSGLEGEKFMKPGKLTPNETELWKIRCDALLDIFFAAQKITAAEFTITDIRGRIYVDKDDYTRLDQAVRAYLVQCTVEER
jgi:hypothetical protein